MVAATAAQPASLLCRCTAPLVVTTEVATGLCHRCQARAPKGGPAVDFGDSRLPDRFWSKVTPEPNSGCWLWLGALSGNYGHYSIDHKVFWAHRISFEALVGPIEAGLTIDHVCRTQSCVNPAHLEPVSRAVNAMRTNPRTGTVDLPTHCIHGHEFTDANTYVAPGRTARMCRQCQRDSDKRQRDAAAAASEDDEPTLPAIRWAFIERGNGLDFIECNWWSRCLEGATGAQLVDGAWCVRHYCTLSAERSRSAGEVRYDVEHIDGPCPDGDTLDELAYDLHSKRRRYQGDVVDPTALAFQRAATVVVPALEAQIADARFEAEEAQRDRDAAAEPIADTLGAMGGAW